jgi:hypothetical protein
MIIGEYGAYGVRMERSPCCTVWDMHLRGITSALASVATKTHLETEFEALVEMIS